MNINPKFYFLACLTLGGCIGDEPGLEAEEPDLETGEPITDTTEQAVTQSHHYTRSFGGDIFAKPFPPYVTEENIPGGDCSPGTVRPVVPVVRWTSTSGGWCAFAGWNSADAHDCRAIIVGGTGGGWFGGTCDSWVEEIPESSTQGAFSFTAVNTSSALVNTTNHSVSLSAGQTLTIGTCGVPGSSFSGDTYLRLYNPLSGVEVASNDDACGFGSQFVYTATSGESLQIRAGCYQSGSCSGTVAWNIQ